MKVKVTQNKKKLSLIWSDGFQSSFHYLWLRDNCNSNKDSQSGQRMILPLNIPLDITPASAEINTDGQLEIVWHHDRHVSKFDLNWLREHTYDTTESTPRHKRRKPVLWDSSFDLKAYQVDYKELLNEEEVLQNWLTAFRDYGFAKLVNVPVEDTNILKRLGEKLSYLWEVPYGNLYDLKILPNATHIGDTNQVLVPHTDNVFSDPPPPVQSIHCIVNEAEGGDSTLVDGFKVAEVLRNKYPEQFKLLSSLTLTFRNIIDGNPLSHEAPVIQLNLHGEVTQIRYSNHSVLPFQIPANLMEAYYEAYINFTNMLNSDEFQIHFRLAPGDFNMIDNFRLLHGRTAFSKNGNRHLRLCFLGRDVLYGRLEKLTKKLA